MRTSRPKHSTPPPPVDTLTLRRLAVLVPCHERTMLRALRGEPIRGHVLAERCAAVIAAHGITTPAASKETT